MKNNKFKVTAIIPARGGSTRLKSKNIYPVCGKPMLYYAVKACRESKYDIDVLVSTDCENIKSVARELNVNIHNRSKKNSNNTAYKQAAIREAALFVKLNKEMPDIFLSLQANSPTIKHNDIDKCIDTLIEYERDEIFSVDQNLMQDAAIRVFKGKYVFQEDLSTNCGVCIVNAHDVHTIEDVRFVENLIRKDQQ